VVARFGIVVEPFLGPPAGTGLVPHSSESRRYRISQTVILTFASVIGLKTDGSQQGQSLVIGSISGDTCALRPEGEGFQTAQVAAG